MKIKSLYLALLFLCISLQTKAQSLPVTTTTIHKVGPTALKVSLVHPETIELNQDRNSVAFKNQLKQQINGTTAIEFNKDVTVDGINLKAGKYLLLLFPGNDWKPSNDAIYAFPGNDWKPTNANIKFPGNDWQPKNGNTNKFPGNDWNPKDSKVKFPGNDWKPKTSNIKFPGNDWKPVNANIKFPGNDWQPKNGNTNRFPGNDWNPKDSKVKFPGNDWKPKTSNIKFPGNDWKPVNDLMDAFPGNDWLVVFYRDLGEKSKKLDKNLIAAEILVRATNLAQPSVNLAAGFVYINQNDINLNLSLDKTQVSIPIAIQ